MNKLKFAPNKIKKEIADFWTILIADDEGTVHMVTEMVLKDFVFDNKSIKFINAYSGTQTIEKLKENKNVAIVLLDVVMESLNTGLDVVNIIRNELENHEIRIILRTGQAGTATVTDIINQYDINEYKNKTSFTEQQLKDTITLALRSYRDIQLAKK